jgi:outer membrane protein OmpA-like peptidoglycan-associated protein
MYTPDGTHIITGGYDGEVRMWKKMFKTAEELVAFEEIDISATEEASLKKGTVIKLPRLFFENNNEKILSAAETDLQQLYLLLLKNPDLKVELCGHSDSSAESEHGLRLSERRAEAVKKYLVERGIAAFRLPVRAFGGLKPLYTQQKELRKYNRRVDAVVINN